MKLWKAKTLLIASLILIVSSASQAVVLFDTNYMSQTYAIYDTTEAGSIRGIGFGGDSNLYVVHNVTTYGRDGSIIEISPDGLISTIAEGLVLPNEIVWGGGTEFGDYLYTADQLEETTWSKGEITRIDSSGNMTSFAGDGMNQPLSLDIDRLGNFGGDMFVGSSAYDRLTRVSADGQTELFYTFSFNNSASPLGIAIDPTGDFGGLMYVGVGQTGSSLTGILAFDSESNVESFSPEFTQVLDLKFDLTGVMFGGDLYVYGKNSISKGKRIWKISPDGSVEVFAYLQDGTFTFGPDGAMYVYEQIGNTAVISRIIATDEGTVPSGDPYDVAVKNIEDAIAANNDAIAIIGENLAREMAAIVALNELADVEEFDFINILHSKISIFHAIGRQIKARFELEKGIGELEESLLELQSDKRHGPKKKSDSRERKARDPKVRRKR